MSEAASRKNRVIYTSMTGGYDELPVYPVIDERYDYIFFTNDFAQGEKVGQWTVRNIPCEIDDQVRLSRYSKLLPHRVLPEYEWSVWADANLRFTGREIYDIIDSKINEGELWCGISHPQFDCLYDDARQVLRVGKAMYGEVKPQVDFLRSEGFPAHYGLFENNMILRRHNDPAVVAIDEEWWSLLCRYSRRDQFGLFYLFWKQGFTPSLLLPEGLSTHNVDYISFIHHKRPSWWARKVLSARKRLNKLMMKLRPL